MLHAPCMRIRHYRELACFQLSASLRAEMSAVLDRPMVRRDLEFCTQVRDALRSAVSNIAEGFGRSDADFLRYLAIAMGSLREIETFLDEAELREYARDPELARLRTLAKRAHCAAARLCAYLRRSGATDWRRRTPRRRHRRT